MSLIQQQLLAGQSVTRDSVVLVVDDNPANRFLLQELLRKEGYRVLTAEDGIEAIKVFAAEHVDFVLMDVMMPGMDGYEATRRIKQMCVENNYYCPVLFITAMSDEESLVSCIECGGDNFLIKPYNHNILRAKMRALERTRDLYALAQLQKNELELHHEQLRYEHNFAERTFNKLMRAGCLDVSNLNYLLAPVGLASGDLLLAEYRPDGVQYVLVGDFTGHGLAAAMGAIPVADIFQSMTRKGFEIDQIATEINRKLKSILPVGLFLACCLLALDTRTRRVSLWNGGVPEVLLRRADGGEIVRLSSRHLPLGILDEVTFDAHLDYVDIHIGDHIYAYSDGLIEAVNPCDEAFGAARLDALLASPRADGLFEVICDALGEFRKGQTQRDDITLIEIECVAPPILADSDVTPQQDAGALNLSVEYTADWLRQDIAQPDLTRLLGMFPGLGGHRSNLYTTLAELFNNALEHGLLELDSELKKDISGFNEYYRQRKQRLRELDHGSIRVDLQHRGEGSTGWMRIQVQDSGPGFDYAAMLTAVSPQGLARRGLMVVSSLCQRVEFHAPGNRVEVLYAWQRD